jgi:hypothetical protein
VKNLSGAALYGRLLPYPQTSDARFTKKSISKIYFLQYEEVTKWHDTMSVKSGESDQQVNMEKGASTLSIMTFRIKTLRITTLSIMGSFVTLSINDTQHNEA